MERKEKGTRSELTYEKIHEDYAGKWVLVAITNFDDYNHPNAGIVLASDENEENVILKLESHKRRKSDPKFALFLAGKAVPDPLTGR